MRILIVLIFCQMSFLAHADVLSELRTCRKDSDLLRRLKCYDDVYIPEKIEAVLPTPTQTKGKKGNERVLTEQVAQKNGPPSSDSSEIREALKAVKKFQAKVRTGISYRDYSSPLSDAVFAVSELSEQSVKSNPEAVRALQKAVEHYRFAGEVWRVKFLGSRVSDIYSRFESPSVFDRLMGDYYPAINEAAVTDRGSGPTVYYNVALQIIWSSASEEIEKASKLMPN